MSRHKVRKMMTDFKCWTIVLLIIFLRVLYVRSQNEFNSSQVLEVFESSFLTSNDDFIDPAPQDNLFPFEKAKSKNLEIDRKFAEKINDDERAAALTEKLKLWRGFKEISTRLDDKSPYVMDFTEEFESFSPDTKNHFLELNMKLENKDIEDLSPAWINLLQASKIDVSNSIDELMKIYQDYPLNTALLYKMISLLREGPEDERTFILWSSIKFPRYLESSVGYMIGYRWNIDSNVRISFETLMTLPSDVILSMTEETFDDLEMPKLLTNSVEFMSSSQEKKCAWFTKFVEEEGWVHVSGGEALEKHGHLMAGASLEYLQKLELENDHGKTELDILFQVLKNNSFSSPRVQVVWEAIRVEDREKIFAEKTADLDISQILSHYRYIGPSEVQHHLNKFKSMWFNEESVSAPWVNVMFTGLKAMTDEHYQSWTEEDIKEFGKFIKVLSPSEIEKLGDDGASFTQEVVTSVVSPSLTLAQLTSIYNKYKAQWNEEENVLEPLHPLLLHALSSAELLSSKPYFLWSQDKDDILFRSWSLTPGQHRALREVMAPGQWHPVNMSSILALSPKCLAEVLPSEVKTNLDQILEGIKTAGQHKFYEIAESVQQLPRYFRMAWLEKGLSEYEREEEDIKSDLSTDVLLDKVPDDWDLEDRVENPDSSHPLHQVFDRWMMSTEKTYLPSLALAGISCQQIMRIKIPDILEILAMYRYQLSHSGDSMPSSTRKCWANHLREYLLFKAEVFNIEVKTETELLSLLNTAEIKTIGGEILLTWGGSVLSSIVNPEVRHEVLMEIALTKPHHFLSNGVLYEGVLEMADNLLQIMKFHEHNFLDFQVLAHVHNLLPFTTEEILQTNATLLKLFVRTVLTQEDKTLCLKRDEMNNMRSILHKAYGSPSTWNSLDLIEMGDLLIVMRNDDLGHVEPTALRMAASELASTSRYSLMMDEVRHSTSATMFHEACLSWLGGNEGKESQESLRYHERWQQFNQFLVVGNFLQFELLHNELDAVPKPRSGWSGRRKKRQASSEIDYKAVYDLVMQDLSAQFTAGSLTDNQKINATSTITETQGLLANSSFAVLGLERGNLTQREVLTVLSEYRDSGNMTTEQNEKIQQLAVDTQVRMIQKLSPLLGLDHQALNLTEEVYNSIMLLPTFETSSSSVTTTTTVTVSTSELLTASTTSTISSSISSSSSVSTLSSSSTDSTTTTTSSSSTEVSLSSSSTTTSSTTTVSTTTLPDNFREPRTTPDDSVSSSSTSTSTTTVSSTTTTLSTSTSTAVVTESSSASSVASESTSTTIASSSSESTTSSTTESTTRSTSTTTTQSAVTAPSEDDLAIALKENELLNLATFTAYEPDSTNFDDIPSLETVVLTCDILIASGDAASSIGPSQISSMKSSDLMNCLETMGSIPWPRASMVSIWKELKKKLAIFQDASLRPIKRDLMIQLYNLLPAVVSEDEDLLDVTEDSIDGISIIGKLLSDWDSDVGSDLIQRYIATNELSSTDPLSKTAAASLGQLLCGMTSEQWKTLISEDVFSVLVTNYLSKVQCQVDEDTAEYLASLLTSSKMYGSPDTWTTADVLSLGWLASSLSPEQLSSIPPTAIEGLHGAAVKYFTGAQWMSLSEDQLAFLSPHAASFLSVKKLEDFKDEENYPTIRVIRAAVGEDPMVMEDVKKMMDEIEIIEDDKSETKGEGSSGSVFKSNCMMLGLIFILVIWT